MIFAKIIMLHQRQWSLPSAMEMFNIAPKQEVKYAFFTGDDESTTKTHIRQKASYELKSLVI